MLGATYIKKLATSIIAVKRKGEGGQELGDNGAGDQQLKIEVERMARS